jgi:hypothetical protein
MTEAAGSRRRLLTALAGFLVVLGAVAVVVIWDPVGSLVRSVDLPEGISRSDVPDVPRWLLWALGKVKFALIGLVLLVAVVRELRRTREA